MSKQGWIPLQVLLLGLTLSVGCDDRKPPRRTPPPSQHTNPDTGKQSPPAPDPSGSSTLTNAASEQSAPLYADAEIDRFRFAQKMTPPHRIGMFRAALAASSQTADPDDPHRLLKLARAWELAGPMPVADHVARQLYHLLEDTELKDAGRTGLSRMNATLMLAAANRAARMGEPGQAPASDPPEPRLATTRQVCPGGDCKRLERRQGIPRISPSPTREQFDAAREERKERAEADLGARFSGGEPRVERAPLTADQRVRVRIGDKTVGVPIIWSPERFGNLPEGAAQIAMELYIPRMDGPGDRQLRFGRMFVTLPFQSTDGQPLMTGKKVVANLCRTRVESLRELSANGTELWHGGTDSCGGLVVEWGDQMLVIAGLGLGETFAARARSLLAPEQQAP